MKKTTQILKRYALPIIAITILMISFTVYAGIETSFTV